VIAAIDELILIDCGLSPDPSEILCNIKRDGLDPKKLKYLLLTHAHPDHANACAWFRASTGVRIWASEYEAGVLENGLLETVGLETDNDPGLEQFRRMNRLRADGVLCDGETLNIGDLTVTALLTPGHTHGSMCFEVEINGKKMLFAGDEVFYNGFISVLAPPLSDYANYRRGLARLCGRGIDGLFPSHLMWTLRGGQKHIDKAMRNFTERQRPDLKLYS
jgi:glyoxylase-like metal-dependent hydrolase (beta-lactamase superfamily II)